MHFIRLCIFLFLFYVICYLSPAWVSATDYYIAPNGNDTNNGTIQSQPLKTFESAWAKVMPGDTLYLLDGTYTPNNSTKGAIVRPNYRDGQSGSPITIKALNDGKAIIDGQYQKIPVQIGEVWAGADPGTVLGNWFVIEGIVAKNSSAGVYLIYGDHNIFRRISGYNANTNDNQHVFLLWSEHNLVEDCVMAGSGRKMMVSFGYGNNIIRRCFAAWMEWQGANFCPGPWPWGDAIETYNSSNNIYENNIVYGRAMSGLSSFAQGGAASVNNQLLGNMTTKLGMNWDGSNITWPCPSPYNPNCNQCADFTGNSGLRKGLNFGNEDTPNSTQDVRDNFWQDNFSWGNGGLGMDSHITTKTGNQLIRNTLINNGLGDPIYWAIDGLSLTSGGLADFNTITADNHIDHTQYQGEGAHLRHRYVNGQLTNQELWPWPMEDRIKQEFQLHLTQFHTTTPQLVDFSVTNTIVPAINQYTAEQIPLPLLSGTPVPTPIIGDLDADSDVDFLDLLQLIFNFNTGGPGNFNLTGLVDIFDFNTLLSNL